MRPALDQSVKNLFAYTKDQPAQQVGAVFVEYVLEADHGGWDGVPSKDKAAIARFLQDFVTYAQNAGKTNPVIYTGSEFMTADR